MNKCNHDEANHQLSRWALLNPPPMDLLRCPHCGWLGVCVYLRAMRNLVWGERP